MRMVLYIGRFVLLYLLMLLAGFVANLAYHGNLDISTWNDTGKGWMVFTPLFFVIIFFVMDLNGAFEDY